MGEKASQARPRVRHPRGARLWAGEHPTERMTTGSGGSSDPAGSRGQGQGGMDVEAVVPAQRAASGVLADRMAAGLEWAALDQAAREFGEASRSPCEALYGGRISLRFAAMRRNISAPPAS